MGTGDSEYQSPTILEELKEASAAQRVREVKSLDFILSETGNHWRVLSWAVTGPNVHCKRIILLEQG